VPLNFVVPNEIPWEDALVGLKLGSIVRNIRRYSKTFKPDRLQKLNELGFVWCVDDHLWENKWKALETYKRLHGHLLVPQAFNVPDNDMLWPAQTWGMKLGRVVDKLREYAGNLTHEKTEALTR
jgi:hypothetical protein